MKFGVKFVDYVGVRSSKQAQTYEECAEQVRLMKEIAMKHNVAVMHSVNSACADRQTPKFAVFIDGLCYASGSEDAMLAVLRRLAARGYETRRPE